MKKLLSILMVCAMVLSLGASAFAVSFASPTLKEVNEETTAPMPSILWEEEEEGSDKWGLYICSKETGERIRFVGRDDLNALSITKAEKELEEDEFDSLSKEYEKAQKLKDRILKYFFWLGFKDKEEKLAEDEYLELQFVCWGQGVDVTANGNDMETYPTRDKYPENKTLKSYTAELTELGAIGIWVDAEEH